MKALVFSDTHGRTLEMLQAIDKEQPDMVLHLGDCVPDVDDIANVFDGLPVRNVCGNNDWSSDAPESMIVTLGGVRVFLTHGHLFNVRRNRNMLVREARRNHCAVALYGHTHQTELGQYGEVLVCNPGSISMPYFEPPSYLRLTAGFGRIKPELVFLKKKR